MFPPLDLQYAIWVEMKASGEEQSYAQKMVWVQSRVLGVVLVLQKYAMRSAKRISAAGVTWER